MAVRETVFHNQKFYTMEYQELEEEAYDLVIAVLASYATDIRKAATLEEKEKLITQFKKSHFTQYFDDDMLEYIERLLRKEFDNEQDNGTR